MSRPRGQKLCATFSNIGSYAQDVPVASAPPLWQALRAALKERGVSVRAFARMLNEEDPRQTFESWKRTIGRYLDEDAVSPTVPSLETARLMARLLGYPEDSFVRPQRRVELRQERDELRQENQRLRDLLRERGIDPEG